MTGLKQTRTVIHRTTYRYETATDFSKQIGVLIPTINEVMLNGPFRKGQCTLSQHITVEPEPAILMSYHDYLMNTLTHFEITYPHDHLSVTSQCEVDVYSAILNADTIQMANTPSWSQIAQELKYTANQPILFDTVFRFPSKHVKLFKQAKDFGLIEFQPDRPIVEATFGLMNTIFKEFKYTQGATHINTPVIEVFNTRKGVCQDFAHFMLSVLRSLGLSARYVSGYMLTDPPPGKEKLIGADASHAWVSLWCGKQIGWVDFDPTNNKLPDQRYVTTALGRDYADIPPLRGIVFGGGKHELKVEVTVT